MKRIVALMLATLIATFSAQSQPKSSGYPIEQVPFTSVKVAPDTFWGQRLKASREVTIPPRRASSRRTWIADWKSQSRIILTEHSRRWM